MRLARIRTKNGIRVALVSADGRQALPPLGHRLPGISDPELEQELPLSSAKLMAPLQPSKVIAIGRNYRAHAQELGNDVPRRPLIFLKAPSSVIGPGERILLPPDSSQVEHEAELGVVISKSCRHVPPHQFTSVVAGYVALNDVTARDLQRADGQFARGKGFDSFCPIGPWMETDLNPLDLALSCRVNGELRQRGRTSQMVFPVPTLIATISRVMTLEPGDIIATGTPAGVGPLKDGDVVDVEIEGLGVLSNQVRQDQQAPPVPSG
ncbi:MAG: 2-hydroxyhepta-2,4-diene-1,7-dioate isomerase [Rickettsiales bacterium]|nr:2-hydroxyhepta-2,4-diene-1,7-dioate isomerase [Rickettsiales bacterium]